MHIEQKIIFSSSGIICLVRRALGRVMDGILDVVPGRDLRRDLGTQGPSTWGAEVLHHDGIQERHILRRIDVNK